MAPGGKLAAALAGLLLSALLAALLATELAAQGRPAASSCEVTVLAGSGAPIAGAGRDPVATIRWTGPCDDESLAGPGEISLPDGTVHRGQVRRSGRNGVYWMQIARIAHPGVSGGPPTAMRAVIVRETGEIYVGDVADGERNGKGRIVSATGEIYSGDWRDGQPHGHGIFAWPDGTRYVGGFVDGGVAGYGVLTHPDGTLYEGLFADGRLNGHGTYRSAAGDTCEGDWSDGRLQGTGRGWRAGRQRETSCHMSDGYVGWSE